MAGLLSADKDALNLFFTEDIYLVKENGPISSVTAQVTDPVIQTPVASTRTFKSLGNNKRNILILVNDTSNEVSDEKGRELLRKIVKSINLTAADFALVNYATCDGAPYADLSAQFSSTLVFSFGITPQQLQLPSIPQNTIATEGGVKFVFSSVLHELDQDINAKKALWACLQKLGL